MLIPEMTIPEMIEKYSICDGGNGKAIIFNSATTKEELAEISARKPEILAYLSAQAEKTQDRVQRIASIPGLDELEDFAAEWEWYCEESLAFAASGSVGTAPKEPSISVADLNLQYPQAAAYRRASAWAASKHKKRAELGKKAVDLILDGHSYAAAVSEMEAEWENYTIAQLEG